MTRDSNGRRMVTARSTVGIALASVGIAVSVLINASSYLGIVTPAQYREDMARFEGRLDSIVHSQNDIYRLLKLWGITDEELIALRKRVNATGTTPPHGGAP